MKNRELYAKSAISQIPRILSMLDRNDFSPAYGCFDRIYWLDKAIDFPSAILQLNTHNLALVYSYPYPGNMFYKRDKIKEWCFAGMKYWIKIQHKDGSFDEFYPNERGWAGPTGFLLYSMLDSYSLLKDEMPQQLKEELIEASYKAARYLAEYDEVGILANHHAMALLPIYYAYKIHDDDYLLKSFTKKLEFFERLQSPEGWFLEYDGADPGYLSATISFLGKLYKLADEELKSRILKIVEKAINFSGYFVYPNKFYGGSIGSRQTLHFYPHGYEIFSKEFPLARTIADKMLEGLAEGKLVPPGIMPWRYLGYRVQEYLLAYLDYNHASVSEDVKLPYEKTDFVKFFGDAKMLIVKMPNYYLVSNLAKGGVIKVFSAEGDLMYNDCGIIGKLDNGRVVTTQWIDKSYKINFINNEATVEGAMNFAPFKLPTPLTMMAFRSSLLLLGWNTKLSYWLKGIIRNIFITKTKKTPVKFCRKIVFNDSDIKVEDMIKLKTSEKLVALKIGDEFSVRYVPQSLYFQSQELGISGFSLDSDALDKLNHDKEATFTRKINPVKKWVKFEVV
jgi:hypothetical protein